VSDLSGEAIKGLAGEVPKPVHPDPYLQQGGDMVRDSGPEHTRSIG